ncbi:uncharacterized protein B0I36DRAFT_316177 [Microdochium trichocladiopsis]|uniref:Uncharacterized protein n=2 Tax=Microdochium trichocladiopsis TaxID=1682393 RepID=A0A9P9BYV6_9PEZI|nr:uncharacterized protein B0I36DRAFT_316177 [Microdochium trichocladiopsis]KAH7038413.1 hypothetical protein B0I36DRAFT_316177 [Microdochium trichocladiopsis]
MAGCSSSRDEDEWELVPESGRAYRRGAGVEDTAVVHFPRLGGGWRETVESMMETGTRVQTMTRLVAGLEARIVPGVGLRRTEMDLCQWLTEWSAEHQICLDGQRGVVPSLEQQGAYPEAVSEVITLVSLVLDLDRQEIVKAVADEGEDEEEAREFPLGNTSQWLQVQKFVQDRRLCASCTPGQDRLIDIDHVSQQHMSLRSWAWGSLRYLITCVLVLVGEVGGSDDQEVFHLWGLVQRVFKASHDLGLVSDEESAGDFSLIHGMMHQCQLDNL